ncbi:MAG: hypothetical protein ACKOGM_07475 [Solirubrobacterales bacterium]
MVQGHQRTPSGSGAPRLDLPGPSKPIRVEPVEEPGRRPLEVPEQPAEPEVSPERDREPVEVPG